MASAVMGSVGSSVGSLAAGTFGWSAATWGQIGWTAGVLAANYIFAPDGPEVYQEGPRLSDLKVTSSAYGGSIPKVYGSYRISGNIIWALPLAETRHEETQESGKGGGGSSSTTVWYTYTGTWAVALCEGPVAGIKKIWADGKVIYDIGAGASFEAIQASSNLSPNMKIYKGTDDQVPDWVIQSNKPDTPAYRHTVYIVFSDYDLEASGNRIPNINAEVVKAGSTGPAVYKLSGYGIGNYPSAAYSKLNGVKFHQLYTGETPEGQPVYYTNGESGTVLSSGHVIQSTYLNKGSDGFSVYHTGSNTGNNICTNVFSGINKDEARLIEHDHNTHLELDEDGIIVTSRYLAQTYGYALSLNGRTDDPNVRGTINSSIFGQPNYIMTTGESSYIDYGTWQDVDGKYKTLKVPYTIYMPDINFTYDVLTRFDYTDGKLHFIVKDTAHSHGFGVYIYEEVTSTAPANIYGTDPVVYTGGQTEIIGETALNTPLLMDTSFYNGRIYCLVQDPLLDANNPLIRVFDYAGTFIETITLKDKMELDTWGGDIAFYNDSSHNFTLQVGSYGIYLHFRISLTRICFNLLEGAPETINTLYKYTRLGEIGISPKPVNDPSYSPVFSSGYINQATYNHERKTTRFAYQFSEYDVFFNMISTTTISLADIAEEVLLASSLEYSDYDVTGGISTEVEGYTVPRNISARTILEPLLSAYDFALVEHNHKIYLKKQQQNSVANIPEEDLGANEDNKIENNVTQEIDLMKSLTLRYANKLSDYQTSVQSVRRIDTGATKEDIVELAMALTDNQAKQLAEKNLYRNWLSRQAYTFSLTFAYDYLVAGDIVTLNFDGYTKEVRIVKITMTEDHMAKCEAVANNYGVYNSNSEGQDTTINGGVAEGYSGYTDLVLIESPTLSNTYINSSGEMVTVNGESSAWKGCVVYTKTISQDDFVSDSSILSGTGFGTSFGGFTDGPTTVFDEVSVLSISSGIAPESKTKADLLNGLNYAIIGREVIQFVDVADLGNDRYELSTLLRGRRGTESYTSTHAEREQFALLDNQSTFSFVSKTIGSTSLFGAVTLGQDITQMSVPVEHAYTGLNLKPFSPSYFRGERSGNDIDLQWMRRSRYISGYFKTLPLVESTELYTIEVYNSSDSLLRTIDNVTTTSYNYDITLDSLTTADDVKFKVYQISSVVGRGYESEYLLIEGI